MMQPKDNLAIYHRDRALAELDRGLTAICPQSARAHLELSSLHMRRAEELGAVMPKAAQTL